MHRKTLTTRNRRKTLSGLLMAGLLLAPLSARIGRAGTEAAREETAAADALLYARPATLPLPPGSDDKSFRNLRPLAAAAGDFDGDGVADLAIGYGSSGNGAIRILRGNVDALFPNDPAARLRREQGTGSDLPFTGGSLIRLSEAADLLVTGDFDNDRTIDLVAASRGARAFQLLAGDGLGGFRTGRTIPVPGAVTAMASGDTDRPDGLPDLLVGVEAGSRGRALLFSGAEGALSQAPEVFETAAAPAAFAVGRLDGDYAIDFAIASGRELLLVSGRDLFRAGRAAARTEDRRVFDSAILSAAVWRLPGSPGPQLAVLTEDRLLHVLERAGGEFAGAEESLGQPPAPAPAAARKVVGERSLGFDGALSAWPAGSEEEVRPALRRAGRGDWRVVASERLPGSPAGLVPMRITGEEARSLAVLEPGSASLRILSGAADASPAISRESASPLAARTLEVGGSPIAVLPMRLNADGVPDLVVLEEGSISPSLVMSAAAAVFTVTSTANQGDCNTSNSTCETDTGGGCPSGPCTLRAAMQQANATGGADVIQFSIGSGPVTISPTSLLPILTGPVTIDGTSQPGFAGTPIVEIDGISAGNPANGFTVDGGSSTIRGLVIGRFTFRGIELRSPGNFVEGNYVGTNVAGTAARPNALNGILVNNFAGNTIGGLVSQARNLVSGNNGDGIEIFGPSATGNSVQGNYIGTNASATGPLGNGVGSTCAQGADGPGLVVNSASNNTLGGTAAGARNVVSGNLCDGIVISGPAAGGNLIQGNYVGTNAAGTGAVPNSVNAFGGGIRIVAPSTTVGGTAAGAGNLVSGNFEDGIEIPRPDMLGNVVQGNLVGTDVTGAAPLGNEIVGILVPLLPGGTIGGTSAAARNVVSANAYGVAFIADAHDVLLQGNYIGTNAAGTAALGNAIGGVLIEEARDLSIGGSGAGAGNVISGNLHGIIIANGNSTGNLVRGNRIGTRPDGATPLPNTGRGVFLTEGALQNEIGGTGAGAGNTIAFNGGIGVWVEALNTGSGVARENAILGNSVFSNGGLGIDLDPAGVTPNDPNDPDTGSNLRQNFPVIATVGPPNITLTGTLNSTPSTSFRIEFFTSATADPSGNGEGQTFLGFTNVATNASGNASFNVTFPGTLPTDHVVTATATDPAGNTSEYSCAAPCLTSDLEVNVTDDAADTDTGDDICDADTSPGNQCTLRAAIQTANLRAGTDTITFDIAGAGIHTISPASALPAITQPVMLDATTQPGYTNTPLIRIDGAGAGGGTNGLLITAGDSTVKGLIVTRFGGHGLLLQTGGNNTVQGCIFGSDANGAPGLGNGGNGVSIENSSNNTIGGIGSPAQLSRFHLHPQAIHSVAFFGSIGNMLGGNLLNGLGITGIGSIANKVLGNVSGSIQNLSGQFVKVPNGLAGLLVNDGKQTEIGALLGGNIFSGNGQFGVQITGQAAQANNLFANIIGTDPNGAAGFGNGKDGVSILNAIETTLGGSAAGEGNTIVGNAEYGVQISQTFDCLTQLLTRMNRNAIGIVGNLQFSRGPGKASERKAFFGLANLLGGLKINNALGNLIGPGIGSLGNLISGNLGAGITLTGPCAKLNQIKGNFVGTDDIGSTGLGNTGDGIRIEGAPENTIGGGGTGEGNTIVGSQGNAISVIGQLASRNNMFGNLMGVFRQPNGILSKIANLSGLFINGAPETTIGGPLAGLGNIISGNTQSGVQILGQTATLNKLFGNFIGTDPTGASGLGNGKDGISILNSIGTLLGGSNPGEGNTIAGNAEWGVQIQQTFDCLTQMLTKMHQNAIGVARNVQPGRGTAGKSADGLHKAFFGLGNGLGGVKINNSVGNLLDALGFPAQIGNLIGGNAGPGLLLTGPCAKLNQIKGNFVGTDDIGSTGLGNTGDGMFLDGAPENVVDSNTFAGNLLRGLVVQGQQARVNTLLRNLVGLARNLQGDFLPLPNLQGGILISDSPENIIGSPVVAAGGAIKSGPARIQATGGNVISGNGGPGLTFSGAEAKQNLVQSNFIGSDGTGFGQYGNASHGVFLTAAARLNVIGGPAAGAGNVIAFNAGAGVSMDGTAGHCNVVDPNSIFANGGPGIDLNNDNAPTANDPGDPDNGPNKLQNFPEMTGANIQPNGDLVIQYKVDSHPANSNYGSSGLLVEFFKADKGLEGRFFAGSARYTLADYNNGTPGVATVNLGLASARNVYPGDRIVATATDADNNTSEFTSVGVGVIPGLPGTSFYTVTPCRVADTRDAPGPYGAPALAAGAERTYTIGGRCGIPVSAKAVSFNITVTGPTFFGHLSLYPGATFPPLVSSINFRAGQTRANNAIVPLGTGGTLAVSNGQPAGTTEFIIDVNGYFE